MKSVNDYHDLGSYFALDYLGPEPPPLTTVPVSWRCQNCNRTFDRSYRQLRRRKSQGMHGCKCQGRQALKPYDYKRLAASLGISWLGPYVPPTTRSRTRWKSGDKIFAASYRDLFRGVPERLQEYFGG